MRMILAISWWLLFMRGVAALLLGTLTVTLHKVSLYDLALVFFGYVTLDAVGNAAGGITAARKREPYALLFIQAIVGFIAAMLTVAIPGLSMMGLIYIISGWALAMGALAIMYAVRLRRHVDGKWLLALSGAASFALGILMIAVPLAGLPAVVFWIGTYAFVFGILLIILAIRLRSLVKRRGTLQSRPAA